MKGTEFKATLLYYKMVPPRLQEKTLNEGILGIMDWAIHGPDLDKDLENEEAPSCSSIYGLCE